ncbi:MAG TPA: flagellar FliJ family protein [Candidatus Limnocylindrales bacterium]
MSRRFRLSVVLRLREMAEDARRVELAAALADHARAVAAADALAERVRLERRWLTSLQRGASAAGELQAAAAGMDLAERGLAAGRERVAAAAARLLEARRALAEASRRREVVERLRDRFVAAQRLEADRREAAELSEISISRHAWRLVEDGRS